MAYPVICQDGFPFETINCQVWKLEYYNKDTGALLGIKYIEFSLFGENQFVFQRTIGNCYATFRGNYVQLPMPTGETLLQFLIRKDLFLFTYSYIGIHLYCGNGYIYNSQSQKVYIYATMTNVTQDWLDCFPQNWSWPWNYCPD
jgi:hypothetical protein